jgi:hypothetical protein
MRSKPPEYRAQNFSLQQINLFTLNSLRGKTSRGSNLGWNGIVRGVVFLANQAQSSCTTILEFIGLCNDSGFFSYSYSLHAWNFQRSAMPWNCA